MEHKLLKERRREQLSTLLTIILQSTTIMPFRWHESKYMCYYCRSLFVKSSNLKEHMAMEHGAIDIEQFIVRSLYSKGRIKIDVTDIWCSRCENDFDSFQDYFTHLAAIHDIFIDEDTCECFDCYNLGDDGMSCLDCGQNFRYFGPLLIHRHKYHTELVLCEICGQGFVGQHNVDTHVKQIHEIKSCKYCDLKFSTQYALANHVENVHRTDKLKCPLCSEILGNRYLKKRHMALVHDCKNAQFVCELCSKIFTRNNKYVQHISRVHFKEKNCTCEVCGHKAFNTDAMRRHMVCHDATKRFKCELCEKAFRRKKTLVIHMKTHKLDDVVIVTKDSL